uniref:Glycosyltransferase 2-like domain-containing protein n=1 Tax=Tanacetum cinerariifolium TaxID=118510 RepID=A0A699GFW0_TANCI|nr:hypothetical protein [Tanacetum cinerariifolium]
MGAQRTGIEGRDAAAAPVHAARAQVLARRVPQARERQAQAFVGMDPHVEIPARLRRRQAIPGAHLVLLVAVVDQPQHPCQAPLPPRGQALRALRMAGRDHGRGARAARQWRLRVVKADVDVGAAPAGQARVAQILGNVAVTVDGPAAGAGVRHAARQPVQRGVAPAQLRDRPGAGGGGRLAVRGPGPQRAPGRVPGQARGGRGGDVWRGRSGRGVCAGEPGAQARPGAAHPHRLQRAAAGHVARAAGEPGRRAGAVPGPAHGGGHRQPGRTAGAARHPLPVVAGRDAGVQHAHAAPVHRCRHGRHPVHVGQHRTPQGRGAVAPQPGGRRAEPYHRVCGGRLRRAAQSPAAARRDRSGGARAHHRHGGGAAAVDTAGVAGLERRAATALHHQFRRRHAAQHLAGAARGVAAHAHLPDVRADGSVPLHLSAARTAGPAARFHRQGDSERGNHGAAARRHAVRPARAGRTGASRRAGGARLLERPRPHGPALPSADRPYRRPDHGRDGRLVGRHRARRRGRLFVLHRPQRRHDQDVRLPRQSGRGGRGRVRQRPGGRGRRHRRAASAAGTVDRAGGRSRRPARHQRGRRAGCLQARAARLHGAHSDRRAPSAAAAQPQRQDRPRPPGRRTGRPTVRHQRRLLAAGRRGTDPAGRTRGPHAVLRLRALPYRVARGLAARRLAAGSAIALRAQGQPHACRGPVDGRAGGRLRRCLGRRNEGGARCRRGAGGHQLCRARQEQRRAARRGGGGRAAAPGVRGRDEPGGGCRRLAGHHAAGGSARQSRFRAETGRHENGGRRPPVRRRRRQGARHVAPHGKAGPGFSRLPPVLRRAEPVGGGNLRSPARLCPAGTGAGRTCAVAGAPAQYRRRLRRPVLPGRPAAGPASRGARAVCGRRDVARRVARHPAGAGAGPVLGGRGRRVRVPRDRAQALARPGVPDYRWRPAPSLGGVRQFRPGAAQELSRRHRQPHGGRRPRNRHRGRPAVHAARPAGRPHGPGAGRARRPGGRVPVRRIRPDRQSHRLPRPSGAARGAGMNAAWGLCGFYGRLHDGPARAPAAATLQAMGARLSAAAARRAAGGDLGPAVARWPRGRCGGAHGGRMAAARPARLPGVDRRVRAGDCRQPVGTGVPGGGPLRRAAAVLPAAAARAGVRFVDQRRAGPSRSGAGARPAGALPLPAFSHGAGAARGAAAAAPPAARRVPALPARQAGARQLLAPAIRRAATAAVCRAQTHFPRDAGSVGAARSRRRPHRRLPQRRHRQFHAGRHPGPDSRGLRPAVRQRLAGARILLRAPGRRRRRHAPDRWRRRRRVIWRQRALRASGGVRALRAPAVGGAPGAAGTAAVRRGGRPRPGAAAQGAQLHRTGNDRHAGPARQLQPAAPLRCGHGVDGRIPGRCRSVAAAVRAARLLLGRHGAEPDQPPAGAGHALHAGRQRPAQGASGVRPGRGGRRVSVPERRHAGVFRQPGAGSQAERHAAALFLQASAARSPAARHRAQAQARVRIAIRPLAAHPRRPARAGLRQPDRPQGAPHRARGFHRHPDRALGGRASCLPRHHGVGADDARAMAAPATGAGGRTAGRSGRGARGKWLRGRPPRTWRLPSRRRSGRTGRPAPRRHCALPAAAGDPLPYRLSIRFAAWFARWLTTASDGQGGRRWRRPVPRFGFRLGLAPRDQDAGGGHHGNQIVGDIVVEQAEERAAHAEAHQAGLYHVCQVAGPRQVGHAPAVAHDPGRRAPRQPAQQQINEQPDKAMFAQRLKINAVGRVDGGGVGRVHEEGGCFGDFVAATEKTVAGQVVRHVPGVDAAHGRAVGLVCADAVHALAPAVRHEQQGQRRQQADQQAGGQLVMTLQPHVDDHGGNRQQAAARVRPQRGQRREQHHRVHAVPHPAPVAGLLQVAHQGNGHDQRQRQCVVVADKSAHRSPHAVLAAAAHREQATLDPVKPQRQRQHPHHALDVRAGADHHHDHQAHQHDLHDLAPLDQRGCGENRKQGGDVHPQDERDQGEGDAGHRQRLGLLRHGNAEQRGHGNDQRERKRGGKSPALGVRIHHADPDPHQHAIDRVAEDVRQAGKHDQGNEDSRGAAPLLTVLMATHNGAATLARVLDGYRALQAPAQPWQLVVIDNASTDDTVAVVTLHAQGLPMRLLHEPRRGKNLALNAALAQLLPAARADDLFLFTDDDAIPAADWLQQWEAAAAAHPDYAVFGGAIVADWAAPPPEWLLRLVPMGLTFGLNAGLNAGLAAGSTTNQATDLTKNVTAGTADGPVFPGLVWGANMAVRAAVFAQGHRFDTTVGPGGGDYAMGSETEFVRRVALAGHRSWHCGAARVAHHIRGHQLTLAYVLQKARRFGRGKYRQDRPGMFPELAGVPRWMWRQYLEALIGAARAAARRDSDGLLRARWDLAYLQGYFREAWRGGRSALPAAGRPCQPAGAAAVSGPGGMVATAGSRTDRGGAVRCAAVSRTVARPPPPTVAGALAGPRAHARVSGRPGAHRPVLDQLRRLGPVAGGALRRAHRDQRPQRVSARDVRALAGAPAVPGVCRRARDLRGIRFGAGAFPGDLRTVYSRCRQAGGNTQPGRSAALPPVRRSGRRAGLAGRAAEALAARVPGAGRAGAAESGVARAGGAHAPGRLRGVHRFRRGCRAADAGLRSARAAEPQRGIRHCHRGGHGLRRAVNCHRRARQRRHPAWHRRRSAGRYRQYQGGGAGHRRLAGRPRAPRAHGRTGPGDSAGAGEHAPLAGGVVCGKICAVVAQHGRHDGAGPAAHAGGGGAVRSRCRGGGDGAGAARFRRGRLGGAGKAADRRQAARGPGRQPAGGLVAGGDRVRRGLAGGGVLWRAAVAAGAATACHQFRAIAVQCAGHAVPAARTALRRHPVHQPEPDLRAARLRDLAGLARFRSPEPGLGSGGRHGHRGAGHAGLPAAPPAMAARLARHGARLAVRCGGNRRHGDRRGGGGRARPDRRQADRSGRGGYLRQGCRRGQCVQPVGHGRHLARDLSPVFGPGAARRRPAASVPDDGQLHGRAGLAVFRRRRAAGPGHRARLVRSPVGGRCAAGAHAVPGVGRVQPVQHGALPVRGDGRGGRPGPAGRHRRSGAHRGLAAGGAVRAGLGGVGGGGGGGVPQLAHLPPAEPAGGRALAPAGRCLPQERRDCRRQPGGARRRGGLGRRHGVAAGGRRRQRRPGLAAGRPAGPARPGRRMPAGRPQGAVVAGPNFREPMMRAGDGHAGGLAAAGRPRPAGGTGRPPPRAARRLRRDPRLFRDQRQLPAGGTGCRTGRAGGAVRAGVAHLEHGGGRARAAGRLPDGTAHRVERANQLRPDQARAAGGATGDRPGRGRARGHHRWLSYRSRQDPRAAQRPGAGAGHERPAAGRAGGRRAAAAPRLPAAVAAMSPRRSVSAGGARGAGSRHPRRHDPRQRPGFARQRVCAAPAGGGRPGRLARRHWRAGGAAAAPGGGQRPGRTLHLAPLGARAGRLLPRAGRGRRRGRSGGAPCCLTRSPFYSCTCPWCWPATWRWRAGVLRGSSAGWRWRRCSFTAIGTAATCRCCWRRYCSITGAVCASRQPPRAASCGCWCQRRGRRSPRGLAHHPADRHFLFYLHPDCLPGGLLPGPGRRVSLAALHLVRQLLPASDCRSRAAPQGNDAAVRTPARRPRGRLCRGAVDLRAGAVEKGAAGRSAVGHGGARVCAGRRAAADRGMDRRAGLCDAAVLRFFRLFGHGNRPRSRPSLPQPDGHHAARRAVARRRLDLCRLGRLARAVPRDPARLDRVARRPRAALVGAAADVSRGAGRVGRVPRARPGHCGRHLACHGRRQRRGAAARDGGLPRRAGPAGFAAGLHRHPLDRLRRARPADPGAGLPAGMVRPQHPADIPPVWPRDRAGGGPHGTLAVDLATAQRLEPGVVAAVPALSPRAAAHPLAPLRRAAVRHQPDGAGCGGHAQLPGRPLPDPPVGYR